VEFAGNASFLSQASEFSSQAFIDAHSHWNADTGASLSMTPQMGKSFILQVWDWSDLSL
jgi:hypothetical protein